MSNRAKQKGYRGEVEVMQIVGNIVKEEYERAGGLLPPELARSPHGRDIRGLNWIALEVKRHEPTLGYTEVTHQQIKGWWEQAKAQAQAGQEPVLIYRANYQPWRIRMFGKLHTQNAAIKAPVDISIEAFETWLRVMLREKLAPRDRDQPISPMRPEH